MCISVHVCFFAYVCISVHAFISVHVWVYGCFCACVWVSVHVCVCAVVCVLTGHGGEVGFLGEYVPDPQLLQWLLQVHPLLHLEPEAKSCLTDQWSVDCLGKKNHLQHKSHKQTHVTLQ